MELHLVLGFMNELQHPILKHLRIHICVEDKVAHKVVHTGIPIT